jgi:2-methylisocitrate lyase-like PEP mutase family enzyme
MTSQRDKAELLRKLHGGPEVLVVPNAWDAISACVIEAEGFPVIATTSLGMAAVLGYLDGEQIPRQEMLFLVGRIAQTVQIPVTADLEAGYGDAAQTARDLISSGAVGLNLEDRADDKMIPLADAVAAIRAVRAVGEAQGVPLVINARTDIFLAKDGEESTRLDRAAERLNAYHQAGADCLFAPGIADADTIGRMVSAVTGPLNVLASPASPTIPEMKKLGVRRVSFGSGPSRVALGGLQRFLRVLRSEGTFPALAKEAPGYQEIQTLLSRGQ